MTELLLSFSPLSFTDSSGNFSNSIDESVGTVSTAVLYSAAPEIGDFWTVLGGAYADVTSAVLTVSLSLAPVGTNFADFNDFSGSRTLSVLLEKSGGASAGIHFTVIDDSSSEANELFTFNEPIITQMTLTDSGGVAETLGVEQLNSVFAATGGLTLGFAQPLQGTITDNDAVMGKTYNGGSGKDTLTGSLGDDFLYGFKGKDTLDGGAGNDLIDGGIGSDVLIGGNGRDTFVLAKDAGADTITDFTQLDGDKIGLSGGLSFGQLTIAGMGSNTLIKLGSKTLATLTGVTPNLITGADFITI